MDRYSFSCDPVPNPAAVVSGANYRFTLINDVVLRYEWSHDGVFEDRASAFAINRNFTPPEFSVNDIDEKLEIITRKIHVTYDKKRFSPNGFAIGFTSKVTLWGADWHYGETAKDNLGGTARTLDDVDGRCYMGEGILSRSGFSTLDDSQTMLFESAGTVTARRPGDRIDGYMFCYGHDFKAAMKSFFDISGRQPVLPRWALGNWWSRYHPYTAVEYLQLMDKFARRNVPLSVAVIDMDWHQVKGDHIPHAGWTGYTWDREKFPDPEAFGKAIHDRGLKITLNDHPHAGIHHHEDLYEVMAKALGHDISKKAPILFNPTNPKFMEAYLGILHRSLEEKIVDFWWIDWQQGNISQIPGLDPLWLLNHYHFRDHVNEKGEGRGIIFSRYAGPGSHRYPVGFSGDSIVTWESLKFQPEFTATASNIGYGWWSHDIGGHAGGSRDDEMATRWVQFGVFSPIFRLHSSHSQWTSKEPWNYCREACDTMEDFMKLRHRLVPYLHTMNVNGGDNPLVRPLYWEFPTRAEAYEHPNEYFFGSNLVVAPIVEPRNRKTAMARVDVWVPPGRHVDLFTGTVYDGNRKIQMFRSLESIPVLAPEGSIIPLDESISPANGCKNPILLEIIVVVGKDGEFTIVEDPADDYQSKTDSSYAKERKPRKITLDYTQSQGILRVSASEKNWQFRFISLMANPPNLKVSIGESEVPYESFIDESSIMPGLVIQPRGDRCGSSDIVVHLGADPQLSVVDKTSRVASWLLSAQLSFDIKDRIYAAAVVGDGPIVSRISGLLSLSLDGDVIGPVLELLTADSRSAG